MQRRDFLILTAAVSLAPLTARADFVDYTPGLAEEAMARGDRIILDFYATWCTTCARQHSMTWVCCAPSARSQIDSPVVASPPR